MSKIVITGSEGFIGRNLKSYFPDALTVDFIESADLNPFEYLEKFNHIHKQGDIVIHNGACSSTTASDPFYVLKVNFDYSQSLLKKCLENKVRLIYASSASVYGDGPFNEKSLKKPKNLYALSKSMFDDYSSQFLDKGIQIVGLRYFNVYGRYEDNKKEMASVPFKLHQQVKKENVIKIFEGSENYLRDFIHIDDIVSIIKFFIKHSEHSGIYNCGTGIERSFQDIANIFQEKYSCKIEYIKMPDILKGKYQKFTKSDNSKINAIFDGSRISLEVGIKKYLEYLDENFH